MVAITLWLQEIRLFQSCQVMNTRTSREAGQVTHKALTVGLRDPEVGARLQWGQFGVHTLGQGPRSLGWITPSQIMFSSASNGFAHSLFEQLIHLGTGFFPPILQ